jgi:hypothetical protein
MGVAQRVLVNHCTEFIGKRLFSFFRLEAALLQHEHLALQLTRPVSRHDHAASLRAIDSTSGFTHGGINMIKRTATALFICTIALASARGADTKPNIVIILADDPGNADLGYRGSKIRTPHSDTLANGGVRLESYYDLPVCTPARAALMNGRYAMRHGLQTLVTAPSHKYGLPTDEKTLPQARKEVGYVTAMVGKWHLGDADKKYWPQNRGPWDTPATAARLKGWDANKDAWELYDLSKHFSQAEDLADKEPDRLARMKDLFLAEAKANKAVPIGGSFGHGSIPGMSSPARTNPGGSTRPSPACLSSPHQLSASRASTWHWISRSAKRLPGVLYALGGASDGVTLYIDKG